MIARPAALPKRHLLIIEQMLCIILAVNDPRARLVTGFPARASPYKRHRPRRIPCADLDLEARTAYQNAARPRSPSRIPRHRFSAARTRHAFMGYVSALFAGVNAISGNPEIAPQFFSIACGAIAVDSGFRIVSPLQRGRLRTHLASTAHRARRLPGSRHCSALFFSRARTALSTSAFPTGAAAGCVAATGRHWAFLRVPAFDLGRHDEACAPG